MPSRSFPSRCRGPLAKVHAYPPKCVVTSDVVWHDLEVEPDPCAIFCCDVALSYAFDADDSLGPRVLLTTSGIVPLLLATVSAPLSGVEVALGSRRELAAGSVPQPFVDADEAYRVPGVSPSVLEAYRDSSISACVSEAYYDPSISASVVEAYHESGISASVSEAYRDPGISVSVSEAYHEQGIFAIVVEAYQDSGCSACVSEAYRDPGVSASVVEAYRGSGLTAVQVFL